MFIWLKCLLGRPHVRQFYVGDGWTVASGAKIHGEQLIRAYQINHSYKHYSILTHWVDGSRVFYLAAFANEALDLVDPTDEVLNLVVKDLYPQLLIHPDERVRAIAERVCKESKLV